MIGLSKIKNIILDKSIKTKIHNANIILDKIIYTKIHNAKDSIIYRNHGTL